MAQEESKSFGNVIAETAIATLFWLIVGFALLASLFPVLFPAASARFYADLGNVPRAYDCAARAADTDGTVESRQKAVAYAVSLYDETGKTYGVLKSVPAFLKESGETFAEIDRKNIAALDKIYHPSVYSYRDYLAGVLAKVRTKEGKTYVFDGNDFVARQNRARFESDFRFFVARARSGCRGVEVRIRRGFDRRKLRNGGRTDFFREGLRFIASRRTFASVRGARLRAVYQGSRRQIRAYRFAEIGNENRI